MKKSKKRARVLAGRIAAWEEIIKRNGDIVRKLGEKGFKRPGANK